MNDLVMITSLTEVLYYRLKKIVFKMAILYISSCVLSLILNVYSLNLFSAYSFTYSIAYRNLHVKFY